MPSAPRQWGSALQELHCPLPASGEAVRCKSSTAHCPQALWQCIAGVAPPTASRQCGGAQHELHCPLPAGKEAVGLQKFCCPLPTAHKCIAARHTQYSVEHGTKQCDTAHKVVTVKDSTHGAVVPIHPV